MSPDREPSMPLAEQSDIQARLIAARDKAAAVAAEMEAYEQSDSEPQFVLGARVTVERGLLRGRRGVVASSGGPEGYAVQLDNGQIVFVRHHDLRSRS